MSNITRREYGGGKKQIPRGKLEKVCVPNGDTVPADKRTSFTKAVAGVKTKTTPKTANKSTVT